MPRTVQDKLQKFQRQAAPSIVRAAFTVLHVLYRVWWPGACGCCNHACMGVL